jgi:hypothetical protein
VLRIIQQGSIPFTMMALPGRCKAVCLFPSHQGSLVRGAQAAGSSLFAPCPHGSLPYILSSCAFPGQVFLLLFFLKPFTGWADIGVPPIFCFKTTG